jgi:hypothetical protein
MKKAKIASATMVVLMIAVILGTSVSLAMATPSMNVSGKFKATPIPGTSIIRDAGTNLFIYREANGYWTGGISGTTHGHQNIISHGWNGLPPPASTIEWSNVNIESFMASALVDGKTGSLTLHFVGKGYADGTNVGTWKIMSGTGDLANLHGQGSWWKAPADLESSYEGQVHFDP